MQLLRGTKDILPEEIKLWQNIYKTAYNILSLSNYREIRTPIIESTDLFLRSIGNGTDIINKEMYNFQDQGKREITLRPEGTASIARAYINNKLYTNSNINRLWYLGPMFRYERPQKGRHRQFHQLGIECIGIEDPIADIEVIRLAIKILHSYNLKQYKLEINAIGNFSERKKYTDALINYLEIYKEELDEDSQKRLYINPLRILDTKNLKTRDLLNRAPKLKYYLGYQSLKHFYKICEHLSYLYIPYKINEQLVRGLDYYNYTAFEIRYHELGSQDTVCGGGRYDTLIKQIGGPNTPAVGWAIGIERLLILIEEQNKKQKLHIYIAIQGYINKEYLWPVIHAIEKCKISYELDLTKKSLGKQIKQADLLNATVCFIIAESEVKNKSIKLKWLSTGKQETVTVYHLEEYLNKYKSEIIT
uniref:Histidine--tRNA ligase, chloroplastic n=1 Tax=Taenioma perpusillum TaxID=210852 RepID=A0A1Z1MR79_9FLOR|nr:Histidine-tRNA ligase [Taenioma perpusillum]ARW68597.1 Histidine-tRNA ligase [Taenioma perpusillum]